MNMNATAQMVTVSQGGKPREKPKPATGMETELPTEIHVKIDPSLLPKPATDPDQNVWDYLDGSPPKPKVAWTETDVHEVVAFKLKYDERVKVAEAVNAAVWEAVKAQIDKDDEMWSAKLAAERERLEAKWKASMVDVTTALQNYEKQLAAERGKYVCKLCGGIIKRRKDGVCLSCASIK